VFDFLSPQPSHPTCLPPSPLSSAARSASSGTTSPGTLGCPEVDMSAKAITFVAVRSLPKSTPHGLLMVLAPHSAPKPRPSCYTLHRGSRRSRLHDRRVGWGRSIVAQPVLTKHVRPVKRPHRASAILDAFARPDRRELGCRPQLTLPRPTDPPPLCPARTARFQQRAWRTCRTRRRRENPPLGPTEGPPT